MRARRGLTHLLIAAGVSAGVAMLCAAGVIAWRNYEAVYSDFEPLPLSEAAKHPENHGIAGLREVRFRDLQGRSIGGWYAPSHNGAAVVLVHGTNADRASTLPETRSLANAGFGVLAMDWPGYGVSQGRIDWGAGELRGLTAALDWLTLQKDVDAGRLGGYGFSMGSYLLAQGAARDPRLRAVVLAGVPADIVAAARSHRRWGPVSEWPAELAFFSHWDGTDALSAVRAAPAISPRAVLVITSSGDTVVTAEEATRVFQSALTPKELWVLPNAEHGYYAAATQDYGAHLVDFFSRKLLRSPALDDTAPPTR